MQKYYKDLLTSEECKYIAQAMIDKWRYGMLSDENKAPTYAGTKNSFGFYDLPEVLNFKTLSRLDWIIKNDYGQNYLFENAYTRIYTNGSILDPHIDRDKLDITLSVCIYSDIDTEWPMHVSDVPYTNDGLKKKLYLNDYKTHHTPPGSGIACKAREQIHWRDTLHCKEHQKVIQSFYHWKQIPMESKTRPVLNERSDFSLKFEVPNIGILYAEDFKDRI